MQFTITRNEFLRGLQLINSVVERRQNMPILANVLLTCQDNHLSLAASNLELELTGKVDTLEVLQTGSTTVSGKKLIDICRVLPEETEIAFRVDNQKAIIQAGKSRFLLATLPAADFPMMAMEESQISVSLPETALLKLLMSTHFAMAELDVRYYLNGLYIALNESDMCAVATDGHRLSLDRLPLAGIQKPAQFILPRKTVLELMRLLNKDSEAAITLNCVDNAIRFASQKFTLVSRLIEGRYPDYQRVIPKNGDKMAILGREPLKQLLLRVSTLTHEKYRAARLLFEENLLSVSANNAEQEEVRDELPIEYQGNVVEIAFNVTYFLDVLNVLTDDKVKIIFSTAENSVLIESDASASAVYVIMPMSL